MSMFSMTSVDTSIRDRALQILKTEEEPFPKQEKRNLDPINEEQSVMSKADK